MTPLERYRRLPVPAQHAVATAYGVRELRRRRGGEYHRYVDELEIRQWWTPERLAEDQVSRLRSMLTWCAARVPHYEAGFAEAGFDPAQVEWSSIDPSRVLERLPFLDKERVRASPDRFLPDGPRPRMIPQTTGGTTGTPLRYWATLDAVRFNYATYEARCLRWAGVRSGMRLASFHGQPVVPADEPEGLPSSGPFWRHNLAFHQLYCSVYHLSDANLPAYVDRLARFDPQIVAGYTSAIHRLARHIVATGDVGQINPRAVVVSSETLTPSARTTIATAFGCRVTNAYSLGELVAWISECEHGSLHVSTEYGVTEFIDTPAGTELVATGLCNRAIPLIRYRTGDLVEPWVGSTGCPCGRGLPRVASLVGRSDDVIHTPEGTVVGPAPLSLAFQRVPFLRSAQVHQDRVGACTVLLETAPGFTSDHEDFLRQELARRLGATLRVEVEHVTRIERTPGGKERLVVSKLGAHPPANGGAT